jgi:hypothetical protein
MANIIYNSFFADLQNGLIDLTDDTIKVMLVTSAYTPNRDTHTKRSNVTNEVVGEGYTAGGETLAGKLVTQDNDNDRAQFDASDVSWTESTITARGAVIYKSTGTAANDNLITYIDFGENKISSNGIFEILWNANGILSLKQSA